MQTQIAITQGDDRQDNINRALQLLGAEIDLAGCRHILIKPNLVSTVRQLAATHVDALRAVLEFIRQRFDGTVFIAEGAALAGMDAVAVDHLTAHLMGFDPSQIGYLVYCRKLGLGTGDISQMETLGGLELTSVRRFFRPHPNTRQQIAWHLPEAEGLLAAATS